MFLLTLNPTLVTSGNLATKPVCSGHECFKLFSRTRLNDSVGFAFLVRQIPITSHLTNPYELVSVEGKFQSDPGNLHIFKPWYRGILSPVVEISKSHQRTSFPLDIGNAAEFWLFSSHGVLYTNGPYSEFCTLAQWSRSADLYER